jgi:hypothetical protein
MLLRGLRFCCGDVGELTFEVPPAQFPLCVVEEVLEGWEADAE